jgi:DNA-binding XRE family transcriptional regulator
MHLPKAFPKPARHEVLYPPMARVGMVALGASVLAARRRAGLTQRALAERCGLHQSVISRLENGLLPNLRWWRFAMLVGALGPAWDPAARDPEERWW